MFVCIVYIYHMYASIIFHVSESVSRFHVRSGLCINMMHGDILTQMLSFGNCTVWETYRSVAFRAVAGKYAAT